MKSIALRCSSVGEEPIRLLALVFSRLHDGVPKVPPEVRLSVAEKICAAIGIPRTLRIRVEPNHYCDARNLLGISSPSEQSYMRALGVLGGYYLDERVFESQEFVHGPDHLFAVLNCATGDLKLHVDHANLFFEVRTAPISAAHAVLMLSRVTDAMLPELAVADSLSNLAQLRDAITSVLGETVPA